MTDRLDANFEKSFKRGPSISGRIDSPADGSFTTVLFGPSGCGKTTVLRCLAGLERPKAGCIRLGNQTWFDSNRKIFRTPQTRDVGLLFQEYALFPHLTTVENIAFGLRRLPAARRNQTVKEMVLRFQLGGLEARYPHQVSGGQKQRIALARVLARRPRLLLLDEPLSALDSQLRDELRGQLRRTLREFAIPSIVVTHDRVEAMALADQIVVMQAGQVRQSGPVADVFGKPIDVEVARIVGMETILDARIVAADSGLVTVQINSETRIVAVSPAAQLGDKVYACIKAEEVILFHGTKSELSVRNQIPAFVRWLSNEGPLVRVGLDAGFEFSALITRPACEELQLREGEKITAAIKASSIHLIDRGSHELGRNNPLDKPGAF